MPSRPPVFRPPALRVPVLRRPREDHRPSSTQRGYDAHWQKVRLAILAAEPLCRMCAEEGRVTPARDVDHIVPMSEGGAKDDPANLRPLCVAHHQRCGRRGGRFARAGGDSTPPQPSL